MLVLVGVVLGYLAAPTAIITMLNISKTPHCDCPDSLDHIPWKAPPVLVCL